MVDLFVSSCMVDFVILACSDFPEDFQKVRTCLGCWSDACVSLLLTHVKRSYTILGALCSYKSLIVSFLHSWVFIKVINVVVLFFWHFFLVLKYNNAA